MAYDGDGEYLPGEWCTFCKVSVKCRARAEEKMKLARLEFKMPPLLTDAEIEEVLDVWAEEELKPKAQMAYDGDGEYLPGEWCTFCKVSVKCRARAEEKMKLARLEFKMPPLLTDAEIEEVLDVLPDLTKWANEITAYATEAAIHHGKEWNGFKVVEGRSNRKYRDELLVAEAAREHGYTDIYRQTLIPMTEMQKLMGKSAFEEILGDLIYKPPGKPILVPNTDKRPAMNVTNAENEFDKIMED